MTVLYRLASTTLITMQLILLVVLLTPLITKRYAVKGRYYIWLLFMAGLCLPFISAIPKPAVQIDIPIPEVFQSQPEAAGLAGLNGFTESIADFPVTQNGDGTQEPSTGTGNTVPDAPDAPRQRAVPLPKIDLSTALLIVWLAGMLISAVHHSAIYLRFRRFVRRWSIPETHSGITAVYRDEITRMGIRGTVRLMRCKGIHAPMLTGFFKTWVLLPDWEYGDGDIAFLLRHELTHYKRRDLWYKLALVVLKSVYWFNPAVHLMAAQADKDLEMVCDMQVIDGLEMPLRKQYGEIILRMASHSGIRHCRLTTCFVGGKKMLRQRLEYILSGHQKRGIGLFGIICALIIAVSLLVGFNFVSALGAAPSGESGHAAAPNVQTGPSVSPSPTPDVNPIQASAVRKNSYNNLDELKALIYEEEKLIEREFSDISALSISSITDNVTVKRGGDTLTVRYYEWMPDSYKLEVSGGSLSLKHNIPSLSVGYGNNYGWLNEHLRKQGKKLKPVEIIIPESMSLGSVTAEMLSGSLEILGCEFDTVDAALTSGSMTMSDSKITKNIRLTTASGRISMNDNVVSGSCKLSTASGGIDVRSTSFSGSSKLSTASGHIYFENCTASDISLSTASGNGTVKLTGSANEYDIHFSAVNGTLLYNGKIVSSEKLENKTAAPRMTLTSSTGSFSVSDNS